MHFDIVVAEDFGADDGVLGEVLGHAAADHQQAGGAGLDLDVGQLAEVGDRVEHHVVAAALHRVDLMLDQPEAGRAVDERRAENRHVMLVGGLDQAVGLLGIAVGEPLAHFPDELAARIGARLEAVGDLADGVVAILQRYFVDIGVVNAVDVERAQRVIVRNFERLIMLVAKRFEEIHVDDGGAGGDDGVDHVGLHQLGVEIHAAAGRGRPGDDQDDRAILVGEHLVVEIGGARGRGW